jgi:hypothetical protein
VGRIVRGRNVHGAKCPWGELSMGLVVHGASCPWGKLSLGRDVVRRVLMGRVVHGASCLGASGPGTPKLSDVLSVKEGRTEGAWMSSPVASTPCCSLYSLFLKEHLKSMVLRRRFCKVSDFLPSLNLGTHFG